jgi:DNA-binding LytR/AlgR family response regulator
LIINCIAIDDEPLAIAKVTTFVSKTPGLKLLKTFDNALEGIVFIKENKVDLIILDIQMEKFTGIQFMETIKNPPQVIITSAFEEYALKGYELNVTDYLLKPYSFERFIQAVDKVFDRFNQSPSFRNTPLQDYLFVKTEYRLERLDFDSIIYIEGMSDYLMVHTPSKKIMTLQNFKYFEDTLPSQRFQRIHKSFLVAIDKIQSIERNHVKMDNKLIPISNTYKDAFIKSLKDKLPPKYQE